VELTGLAAGASYTLRHQRVDQEHSNVAAAWGALHRDGQDWPDDEQWAALHEVDRLEELEPERTVTADPSGVVVVDVTLPMPAMSLLTLSA
jgi:xylan 1,4-beta-xylosidase